MAWNKTTERHLLSSDIGVEERKGEDRKEKEKESKGIEVV